MVLILMKNVDQLIHLKLNQPLKNLKHMLVFLLMEMQTE